MSAPSATSWGPRGAPGDDLRLDRSPQLLEARRRDGVPFDIDTCAAHGGDRCVRAVGGQPRMHGPTVATGRRIRLDVVGHQIPCPSVPGGRGDKAMEAAREDQDRHDDQHTEGGADERRPHREARGVGDRGRARSARRLRPAVARSSRPSPGQQCPDGPPRAEARVARTVRRPATNATTEHHEHDRGEPEAIVPRVEADPRLRFGLGRHADREDRGREHPADDREDAADQRDRDADCAAANVRLRGRRPRALSVV